MQKQSRPFWGNFLRFYGLANLAAMGGALAAALSCRVLMLLHDALVWTCDPELWGRTLNVIGKVLSILTSVSAVAGAAAVIVLLYRKWRERLTPKVPRMLGAIILALAAVLTVLMLVSDGNMRSVPLKLFSIPLFPFFPVNLVCLDGEAEAAALLAGVMLAGEYIYSTMLLKQKPRWKLLIPCALCVALLAASCGHLYANRNEIRYAGHGFDYMGSYSSTDLSDYTVFSDSGKLAELDEPAAVQIGGKLPVMDGAEACYPLYAAVAKAVYPGIEDIEREHFTEYGFGYDWDDGYNGEIVQFSNTVCGFDRLVNKDVDLFFGARPSEEEIAQAWQHDHVRLEVTPIGKEGFVFFVEEDNPVDSLTTEQVKAIYAGQITNWAEVGGKDEEIVAFQRPEGSGSQNVMVYFMGDTALKAPMTYEYVDSMEGVLEEVAQYNNEAGAMGYTFRYFLEGLHQEKHVKMLAIDGVMPTVENIRSGAYPVVCDLCLVTRENDPNPNVRAVIDFMLSPQGQELVEKTGYAPLD